jgi:hypothetical protein
MSLTDGDVALLAEQAATLVPTQVDVRVAPAAADDPYRWGAQSWTVYFGVGPDRDDSIAVWVPADDSPTWALHRLVDGLGQLSETGKYRAVAFPPCRPDHRHPARLHVEDLDVVLRCPDTAQVVARLSPNRPA